MVDFILNSLHVLLVDRHSYWLFCSLDNVIS